MADEQDLTTVLFRRWRASLPIAILGCGVAVLLWRGAVPTYTETSTFNVVATQSLLEARHAAAVDPAGSPLVNPYQDGNTLASLLSISATNGCSHVEGVDGCTVTRETLRETSYFQVTVASGSVAAAATALDTVSTRLGDDLRDLQVKAGAPSDQLFGLQIVDTTQAPEPQYPTRSRMVIGTGLATLLAAILVGASIDGLARRGRNHARVASSASESSGGHRRRPPS